MSNLKLFNPLHLPPVHQPLLLDQQPPPHVAAVEIVQLNKVVMDVDKTEDDCADNTKRQDQDDDGYFLLVDIISEAESTRSIQVSNMKTLSASDTSDTKH